MRGMRPKGSKQSLEVRRRTAVALRKEGLSVREVAARMGCAPSSVTRWSQAVEKRGERGLDSKPQAGGTSRMKAEQKRQLRRLLIAGPRARGWHNDLWTLSRVARLIEEEFGIRYHISHVHRLLHGMGFSAQKPARLARERNDRAVDEFREKRWPAIKKKPARKGARSS